MQGNRRTAAPMPIQGFIGANGVNGLNGVNGVDEALLGAGVEGGVQMPTPGVDGVVPAAGEVVYGTPVEAGVDEGVGVVAQMPTPDANGQGAPDTPGVIFDGRVVMAEAAGSSDGALGSF